MRTSRRMVLLLVSAALLATCAALWAQSRFPPPDFRSGHQLPQTQYPQARAEWRDVVDVAVLVVALGLAAWLTLVRRSRRWTAVLSVGALVYFGFYRQGCICPIGAIQNVSLGLTSPTYYVPLAAVVFFALPLAGALFIGRAFCGGACPLGAIQDVVLIRPVRLPSWLAHALGLFPFFYLGAAVLLAATNSFFLICRYDPFVSFFRMSGAFQMLVAGGVVLGLATFIGRPYCRFLCPYGALLGLLSRVSWKKVSVTPDQCVRCRLCEDACPFDAIRKPTTGAGGEQL